MTWADDLVAHERMMTGEGDGPLPCLICRHVHEPGEPHRWTDTPTAPSRERTDYMRKYMRDYRAARRSAKTLLRDAIAFIKEARDHLPIGLANRADALVARSTALPPKPEGKKK